MVFNSASTLVTSSVTGGANDDSLVFSAVVSTGTTVGGGANSDTGSTAASWSRITLDGGADSVSFVTQVASSTILVVPEARHLSSAVLLMPPPLLEVSAEALSVLVRKDQATFNADVAGTTILGTTNADTLSFTGETTAAGDALTVHK